MTGCVGERGLKRAGVTTHTGRTVDDSCRRTLQPAFLSLKWTLAGAAELGDSSVPARFARPCGVRGSAPLAPASAAFSLVHTYELSRPLWDTCARGTT